jgi:hypothetical protein
MAYCVPATAVAGEIKEIAAKMGDVETREAGTLMAARTVLVGEPPDTDRISTLRGAAGAPSLSMTKSTRSITPLRPAVNVCATVWFAPTL